MLSLLRHRRDGGRVQNFNFKCGVCLAQNPCKLCTHGEFRGIMSRLNEAKPFFCGIQHAVVADASRKKEIGTCFDGGVHKIATLSAEQSNGLNVTLARKCERRDLQSAANGIGKFVPALLRRQLAQEHIPCAVMEKTSRDNKVTRILSAFDAVLMNRALKVNTQVKKTLFITQMQEWTPAGHHKDDALDAVAGCLLNEPVRLPTYTRCFNKKDWRF